MNTADNLLRVGTSLNHGKYRIVRHLASGGFGNTYEAVNEAFDAKCAIKEFFMSGVNHRAGDSLAVEVSNSAMTYTFDSAKKKFKKEAQRLYGIQNEHIVRVHDMFEENNTVYYVMDFIDGNSLNKIMKQQGHPFTEAQSTDILLQMCDALRCIHAQKLWHMDIKPGNIMMDRSGKCTLIDFGASKQTDPDGTNTVTSSVIAQTPGYAPSEQISGNYEHWGPWTDIYALGATVYNLITAQRPPLRDDIDINQKNAFAFPETVSQQMRDLIIRMMQPVYLNRPQSVDEIETELNIAPQNNGENNIDTVYEKKPADEETVIAGKDSDKDVHAQPEVEKPVPNFRNRKKVFFYIALSLLLIGGIIAYFIMNTNRTNVNTEPPVEANTDSPFEANTDSPVEVDGPVFEVNGVSFKMVNVPGGTFTMGGTSEQGSDAFNDESPSHQVTLTAFSIGQTEVTQELWQAVMGNNPSSFNGSKRPVESVSWDDSQTFIRKLNSLTGQKFRLPTEAEWEYAARGGRNGGTKYAGSNSIDDVAWYINNSGSSTHDVATKRANDLGIYDMSGNVWEWCQDWYGDYSSSSQTNPQGPSTGSYRVRRGGSWYNLAGDCRVSYRGSFVPDYRYGNLGLRLAL